MSQGKLQIIGQFIDQYSVPFDYGWIHGARRYRVPVCDGTPKSNHQYHEQDHAPVIFQKSSNEFFHGLQPADMRVSVDPGTQYDASLQKGLHGLQATL